MPEDKERAEAGTSRQTRYPQVFQSSDRHRLWFGQECGLHLTSRSSNWAQSPEPHNPASVFLLKIQPQNSEIWHCYSSSVNSLIKVFPGEKNPVFEEERLDISMALEFRVGWTWKLWRGISLGHRGTGWISWLHFRWSYFKAVLFSLCTRYTRYPVSWWGVCVWMQVCQEGKENAMCWRVLKFSQIALYSEWENGTLWCQWRHSWRGESKLKVCISFFFSLSTSEYLDPNPIALNWVCRTEQSRVLCVSSAGQDRNPGPGYLWKAQEPSPELVCLEGRSRRAQKGSHEEKICRVGTQCPSDNEKSFLLLQRVIESSQVKSFPSLLWIN